MVLCPECENNLDLDEDDVQEGDVVTCVECGTEYEVVGSEPLQLAPISEEELDEDGADDEDGDEDEDEE